jgi:hypothetical protein
MGSVNGNIMTGNETSQISSAVETLYYPLRLGLDDYGVDHFLMDEGFGPGAFPGCWSSRMGPRSDSGLSWYTNWVFWMISIASDGRSGAGWRLRVCRALADASYVSVS